MLKSNILDQVAKLALAATLSLPQIGLAAAAEDIKPARKVIFPGQTLPPELGYMPLKVGAYGDSEVHVSPRDWFLLKDKNLGLANPVVGKNLDYSGPILDAENAQVYFRLISGMVLKESLVQMGMSASQSRHFIERVRESGKDFDSAPLADMGTLPKGLDDLYNNWGRPMARAAILPYLILPLAVAYDQSQFQHFFMGPIEDADGRRTCQAINTAAPLQPVQSKISERRKKMDALNLEFLEANARLRQWGSEQVRMGARVQDISDQIDRHMLCFGVIKDRVSRGADVPSPACVKMVQEALAEAGLQAESNKFIMVNLKNPKGDFSEKQQADAELTALEARLTEIQTLARQLQETKDKVTSGLVESQEKIQRLKDDLAPQRAAEAALDVEQKAIDRELHGLQELNHKLENGTLISEATDADVKAAIAATVTRTKRMEAIKLRLSQILQSKVKLQGNQASMITQTEFLTGGLDAKKAQLQSIEVQLNDKASGVLIKLAKMQADITAAKQKFLKASDEATFSEYIISVLSKKLTLFAQDRDSQFGLLKKEEALAETYKKQFATAAAAKESQLPSLQKETTDLEGLIASYRDVQQMGWFLETDCPSRAAYGANQPGVFLGRAKMSDTADKSLTLSPVEGGRWGLFNMDFQHFQAPIQSGILLNLPAYIQTSVQQIIADYDFAMTQYLDTSVSKCSDTDSARGMAIVPFNMMRTAFLIWNEGSDQKAKSTAFACRTAPVTPKQMAPATAGKKAPRKMKVTSPLVLRPVAEPGSLAKANFTSSLNKLIEFNGSVLDLALPQTGKSHAEDLIERRAISLLGREFGILNGTAREASRRDELIKALMLVLAFDYEAEIAKQKTVNSANNRIEYLFATVAPGRAASPPPSLTAGSLYTVKTLGSVRLYTAPIAKPAYDAGVEFGLDDQVKVLAMDDPGETVRAGWVKVQGGPRELWMPAWPITSSILLDENGQEIGGMTKPLNCPQPRVVTGLTNFQTTNTVVQRFASNLKTVKKPVSGIWTVDIWRTAQVAAASTTKTYLACENFVVAGQVAMFGVGRALENLGGVDYSKAQAIRIIETKVLHASNGQTLYIPVEETGGFVQTWLPNRNSGQPRIILGAEVDPASWRLRK